MLNSMLLSQAIFSKEFLMGTTVSLAQNDPRLLELARKSFPDSPEFRAFLVKQILVHNGSLDVLKFMINAVRDVYVGLPLPFRVKPSVVECWTAELSKLETIRLVEKLSPRFKQDLISVVMVMLVRFNYTGSVIETSKGLDVSVSPRLSTDKCQSVAYIRIFYRVLAMLEGLERSVLH